MTRLLSLLLAFVILTLVVQAVSMHRKDQHTRSLAVGAVALLLIAAGIWMIASGG